MRLLLFGIVLILISSCGHHKIRFTRMPEVIELSPKTVKDPTNNRSDNQHQSLVSETEIVQTSHNSSLIDQEVAALEQGFLVIPRTKQDSTELTDTEKQIIEWQAQKAEHNAKRSTLNSALFLPSVALGVISSFLIGSSIPAIVGAIIGLALLVLGILYYGRASGSRYITPKGERFLKIALITMILNGAAVAVLTLLLFI